MLKKWRAPPSYDGLEALRGLPAAATPLSWASEDSVLVHSAINTVENCRLKDLRLSPFHRVKSAQASFNKMIKRATARDEKTKSVSFADSGLAAPSPSPPASYPHIDSHDAWTQVSRHSEFAQVVRGKDPSVAGAFDMYWYPARRPASSAGTQICAKSTRSFEERMCSAELGPGVHSSPSVLTYWRPEAPPSDARVWVGDERERDSTLVAPPAIMNAVHDDWRLGYEPWEGGGGR